MWKICTMICDVNEMTNEKWWHECQMIMDENLRDGWGAMQYIKVVRTIIMRQIKNENGCNDNKAMMLMKN